MTGPPNSDRPNRADPIGSNQLAAEVPKRGFPKHAEESSAALALIEHSAPIGLCSCCAKIDGGVGLILRLDLAAGAGAGQMIDFWASETELGLEAEGAWLQNGMSSFVAGASGTSGEVFQVGKPSAGVAGNRSKRRSWSQPQAALAVTAWALRAGFAPRRGNGQAWCRRPGKGLRQGMERREGELGPFPLGMAGDGPDAQAPSSITAGATMPCSWRSWAQIAQPTPWIWRTGRRAVRPRTATDISPQGSGWFLCSATGAPRITSTSRNSDSKPIKIPVPILVHDPLIARLLLNRTAALDSPLMPSLDLTATPALADRRTGEDPPARVLL